MMTRESLVCARRDAVRPARRLDHRQPAGRPARARRRAGVRAVRDRRPAAAPTAAPPLDVQRASPSSSSRPRPQPADAAVRVELAQPVLRRASASTSPIPWYEAALKLDPKNVNVSTDLAVCYYYIEPGRSRARADRPLAGDRSEAREDAAQSGHHPRVRQAGSGRRRRVLGEGRRRSRPTVEEARARQAGPRRAEVRASRRRRRRAAPGRGG